MLSEKAKAIIDGFVAENGTCCHLSVDPIWCGGFVALENDDSRLSHLPLFRHYGSDEVWHRDIEAAGTYLEKSQAEFRARYEDRQGDYVWLVAADESAPFDMAATLADAQQRAFLHCRGWSDYADNIRWSGPDGRGHYSAYIHGEPGYGYTITPLKRPDQA